MRYTPHVTPANQFQSAVISVDGVTLWLCEDDRELKSVDCSHWRALISVYPCESVMSDTVQHDRSSSVQQTGTTVASRVYIYWNGAVMYIAAICFLYKVHLPVCFNPLYYRGIHQGAYTITNESTSVTSLPLRPSHSDTKTSWLNLA